MYADTCDVNSVALYSIAEPLMVRVRLNKAERETTAMVDSGSEGNFIHPDIVRKYDLITVTRERPLKVTHVQGGTVALVKEQAITAVKIGGHREIAVFDICPIGKHRIILGVPWLKRHEPRIQWTKGEISFPSPYCQGKCIKEKATCGRTIAKDFEGQLQGLKPVGDKDPSSEAQYPHAPQEDDYSSVDHLEVDAVSIEDKDKIPEEYHDFIDVFDGDKARKLPPFREGLTFKIDFKAEAELPKPAKMYRLTPGQKEEAWKQIQELRECGMIEPSESPMAAPLFFVPKKDGTQRMVIDYRKLNDITVRDAYPLPNMEALLETARGAKVFSKFDLKSAYNLIRIRPEDKWKTAFVTPWGLFQFTVMHYGFVNAPACLQRYMDHILESLIHKDPASVSVYMDDTGTFAKDKDEAVQINREVLKRFRKAGLYCKPSKCEFHKDQVELLGVIVNSRGFEMEDKKVQTVQEWPIPKTLTELRGFIGFCNFYRRFIKNFALISRPLHDLSKKGVRFTWGPEQQRAFEQLKEAVAQEPCLAHANLDYPFRLETDASEFAYGAALSQKQADGKWHPVAFMSKAMLPAERNYDTYDREALGIVKPLQHWKYWLQGGRKPTEIITDHKNLLAGFNDRPTPSKRHLRWLEMLRHYDYVVGYRPGKLNTVADALSRRADHYPQGKEPEPRKPFPEEIIRPIEELEAAAINLDGTGETLEWAYCNMVVTDATLQEEIRKETQHGDPVGEQGLIWVPKTSDLRRRVVELYHDTPITGHLGIAGTYELASRGYTWEGMHDYIRQYVLNCRTCTRAKKRNYKAHGLLKPLPIPEGPWQWTQSDHIVKLPGHKGLTRSTWWWTDLPRWHISSPPREGKRGGPSGLTPQACMEATWDTPHTLHGPTWKLHIQVHAKDV
jgi:hypothetical protein